MENTAALARLYAIARNQACTTWGNGWMHLSDTMRRDAILAACVNVAVGQDESIKPETIVAFIRYAASRN